MRIASLNGFIVFVLGLGVGFAPASQGDDWKAEHDAGWNAYKEGRLDDAERHLLEAEQGAGPGRE